MKTEEYIKERKRGDTIDWNLVPSEISSVTLFKVGRPVLFNYLGEIKVYWHDQWFKSNDKINSYKYTPDGEYVEREYKDKDDIWGFITEEYIESLRWSDKIDWSKIPDEVVSMHLFSLRHPVLTRADHRVITEKWESWAIRPPTLTGSFYIRPRNSKFIKPNTDNGDLTSKKFVENTADPRDYIRTKPSALKTQVSEAVNPKDLLGSKKTPVMSVLPANVLGEVALALQEGALKYGRHNYRETRIRASVYYDACFRHMMDWWEGADVDRDSGISDVTKAIAGLVILRDSMLRGTVIDDRPPKSDSEWLSDLNIKSKELSDKYPEPKKAVTNL